MRRYLILANGNSTGCWTRTFGDAAALIRIACENARKDGRPVPRFSVRDLVTRQLIEPVEG